MKTAFILYHVNLEKMKKNKRKRKKKREKELYFT